jgi:hypothetical protein
MVKNEAIISDARHRAKSLQLLVERYRGAKLDATSANNTADTLEQAADALEAAERRVGELTKERDEARSYGERLYQECSGNARQTACVWCGEVFMDGTPASQNERLYEHAKTCEKHPVKALTDLLAARDAEMLLLAKLAAETPQFDNPLHIVKAQQVRDRILDAALARGTEGE